MSVTAYSYDIAVTEKILGVFDNTVFINEEYVFKAAIKNLPDNHDLKLPLISIYRPDGYTIAEDNKQARTLDGTNKTISNLPMRVDTLFVNLPYVINIYANSKMSLEAITSELLIYLAKSSKVPISFKVSYLENEVDEVYNDSHELIYNSGPVDNSVLEEDGVGEMYRYTLEYNLEAPLLSTSKDVNFIQDVEVEVQAYGREGLHTIS